MILLHPEPPFNRPDNHDGRGRDLATCRSDLLRRIFWVKERYDNIEHEFLDEIDQQVHRYTRATTQKIENLTNRDHNIRAI